MPECTNPVTPDYTRTKPVINDKCLNSEVKVLVPTGQSGKTINLYASTSNVEIDTLRGTNNDDFFVGVPVYINPTVSLTITSPTGVQLNGTTVSNVNLTMTFNKLMQSKQIFVNDVLQSGATFNDQGNNVFTVSLTGLAISADATFKITGNDGTTSVSDTKTLRFGEYLVWAEGIFMDLNTSNTVIASVLEAGTTLGPLTGRAYGSPYIQPQSIDQDVYFYIAIAVSKDNESIDPLDKFYEHDGDDKGGGMFLMKEDVPLDLGQGNVDYNIYRTLFGAQGGALFEVL